jgi:hypothetical protein
VRAAALAALRRAARPATVTPLAAAAAAAAAAKKQTEVRSGDAAAIDAAMEAALASASSDALYGAWQQERETLFDARVRYADFDDFAKRVIGATFADHQLDDAQWALVREHFADAAAESPGKGAEFVQRLRATVLRRMP